MKVLVFAPHNDDEVLGAGGTIAKHIAKGDEVYVCEVTASLVESRKQLMQNEARKVHRFLGVKETIFLDFPVVELPHVETRKFNNAVTEVTARIQPEIVYIPFSGDMHRDHAMVAEAAMVAVRPIAAPYVKTVLAYETLSETGWHYPTADKAFIPNVFIDITEHIEDKVTAMEMYEAQLKEDPHPRSGEGIRALAKFRGGTIGVSYAEAFMCIRYRD
ncbi:MAG: PIG-L family deacetylase [Ruminococcus sp.]|nr:PIG-L family deacetylase [Ruminococcus sp.]